MLSDGFGLTAGRGVGGIIFTGGSEVGAGLTAGEGAMSPFTCDTPVPEAVAAPAEETEPPDLPSDEDDAVEAPEDEAAGDDAGAALSPFGLAPTEAPAPPSDAAANASCTAKSSDTSTAKMNNLLIITPPNSTRAIANALPYYKRNMVLAIYIHMYWTDRNASIHTYNLFLTQLLYKCSPLNHE